MRPAHELPLQALFGRLRSRRRGAAGLALLAVPLIAAQPALAQGADVQGSADSVVADAPTLANSPQEPVAFEADRIEYQDRDEVLVASGNVVLRLDGQAVRANTVTWNRSTGVIVAEGDVRLLDADGNQLFTERVELTDELKTGAMQNMLLALREGARVAAQSGRRLENGNVLLEQAAYSACAVETFDGCPKDPTWRITAREVIYDAQKQRLSFKGARITFFDTLSLPLPGLRTTTDGRGISGLLIPDFRSTPSNGVEISAAHYARLADNRDLTSTAYLYTDALPMAQVQYRALTEQGAYQITGYATSSRRIAIFDEDPSSQEDFRGYLFANGRLQLAPKWSVTASIRRSTDRTFLRRYDISRDDRLRSMVDIERIGENSYLSIAGWTTQTMRIGEDQGQVPVALPAIDYRHRLDDPVFGGRLELQANSLAILRDRGQDSQRAFVRAQWDLRRISAWGQEVTLTGLLRGDVYHSDENDLSPTEAYRGNPGWQTRTIAVAALDVKWPLIGRALGGTQVFTPRVQLSATPAIPNLSIPNEDARAIELEDSNLFALNRFPGYDRIEDGVRFTYGFDWLLERPRWSVKTTVGQSVRLTEKPSLFPQGTGLTGRVSDAVGRTEVRFRDTIKLVHRFRLDKDSLAIRRHEFDAVVGSHRTYLELGYTKLNRDISSEIEDLRDREEVRGAGRVAFANYWSLFGSAVVNLTQRSDDPDLGSDGFQPLRTRLGVAYQDDCIDLSLTWRRDYVATGDARKGNSFQVRFALRNLGFR
jgi:LPS-assembly protein